MDTFSATFKVKAKLVTRTMEVFGDAWGLFQNDWKCVGDVLEMRWGCLCSNCSYTGSKEPNTDTVYFRRGRANISEASTNPEHVKPFAKHFVLEVQHLPNKCLCTTSFFPQQCFPTCA